MAEKIQFNVQLPQDVANRVRAIARMEDRHPASVAEEAFESYFRNRREDPEFRAQLKAYIEEQRALLDALDVPGDDALS